MSPLTIQSKFATTRCDRIVHGIKLLEKEGHRVFERWGEQRGGDIGFRGAFNLALPAICTA
jgi:hypothetical protein